jgi:hypothetical protein
MRNKESESGFNFTLIMPVALLLVLLVVPFSINSFMHFCVWEKAIRSSDHACTD